MVFPFHFQCDPLSVIQLSGRCSPLHAAARLPAIGHQHKHTTELNITHSDLTPTWAQWPTQHNIAQWVPLFLLHETPAAQPCWVFEEFWYEYMMRPPLRQSHTVYLSPSHFFNPPSISPQFACYHGSHTYVRLLPCEQCCLCLHVKGTRIRRGEGW